ncbi:DtxR family transcriptional regulator [candidate division WOR-3 bacterium]|nr:DtxR family transcriptional regulator [candidate division WOR-3 bacterium]
MELTQSLEDYLEAILVVGKGRKIVRVKDIVRKLKVKAASVVGALKTLERNGLVIHERYGYVELTGKGKTIAEDVYKRHKTLYKFLKEVLNVPSAIADKDACNLEHYLSKESFENLLSFLDFVNKCPEKNPKWLGAFRHFQETNSFPEECEKERAMNLSIIKPGQSAKIKKIDADTNLKRRLLDMGVIPGDIVSVVKVAPLGDPIDIKIKNYHLSLRKEEAEKIIVEETE